MAYSPSLPELKDLIDAFLLRFLSERRTALPDAGPLIDEIERLVAAGGKRLRPSFCYWGFRAAGGEHGDGIVAAASSLELLHTFALIHDDIIDRSPERRGQPSVHSKLGLERALLAGDLALVLADAAFGSCGLPAASLQRASGPYARMRQEVIAGQFMELEASARGHVTETEARRIAVMKSGRYSVAEPLAIGASLADAAAISEDELRALGEPLGEAFQIRDDLLGIFGDPASTGKPVDSDVREGKPNVVYAKTVAALDADGRARFTALWGAGDRLTGAELDEVRGLIESSGARAATESLLQGLLAQATEALSALPVPGDAAEALHDLALVATRREL